MKRFHEATSGNIDEFSLVTLGCTAKAADYSELVFHLTAALDGRLAKKLTPNQQKHFNLTGQNAANVADFVRSLL